ncbi:beta/gamma crystallin-related protein [Hydrogenophaga sp. A37]|uniref:beta/gamma crystallin-related protein n=1 Tax=Hydrogenophaga sp. A37 TaxID=1945864 RepID=UPI000985092C|nr:beta/gamma crystallin-related protein [Hydrogenophaga sp. A37]OOG83240.1 hypothetical protein B0E41_13205 [Hydrogenophaga sp. A37]
MNTPSSTLLALACIAFTAPAAAQATFYENGNYQGRSMQADNQVPRFDRYGFNDRSSSVVVVGNRWEVCEDIGFRGDCVVLRPGRYPSLSAMGLNDRVSSARVVPRNARVDNDRYAPLPLPAQATFFERRDFEGESFTTTDPVARFQRHGFNDRASSAVVIGERWEVCEDSRYRGNCVVLRPGRYPTLEDMGLNNSVSSARAVGRNSRADNRREAPEPVAVYDSRRRGGERLYEADVTSARAVLATPGQQCWVEREQLGQAQSNANVPAALAGALIGGILGHQVGGGSGKDIATVGGVIAGAALGARAGRDGQPATQDVQRCRDVPGGARPAYWDVSYTFRGQDHRVQMTSPPGQRITVNEQGEPRQQ